MTIAGFCELTLQASDPAGLAAFYTECFGLVELARDADRVWLAAGERARLGLWRPGVKQFGDQGGAHVHFAFAVSSGSLDQIVARLAAEGVEFRGPVKHAGGDRSLYVCDPEDNLVEAWDFLTVIAPSAASPTRARRKKTKFLHNLYRSESILVILSRRGFDPGQGR